MNCVTASVRRHWPQAQERALKKVSDSLQRRVEVVSVGTKHLDEMSSFHDYQLAKQERQKEHRANVLARVSGHAWVPAAGWVPADVRCMRILNTRDGCRVSPCAVSNGPVCRPLTFPLADCGVLQALGQIEQDEVNAIRSTCVARQLYNSMLDNR